MNLKDCHNVEDFRKLAKKRLPSPIFHYIDGGSDDEVTLKRNTESFNISDSAHLGMSYNHISNASLGDKNPGANSYMLNFLKHF